LNTAVRLKIHYFGFHPRRPLMEPNVRSGLVISWCGMRGIVTLAAALALPEASDGGEFPFRDLVVVAAFITVLGTLVIQGLTLRPLLRLLDLHDDDPVGREVLHARGIAFRAALVAIESDLSPEAEALRQEYAAALEVGFQPEGMRLMLPGAELRRRAIAAGRVALSDLRRRGVIGDDAFHRIEEVLDLSELSAAPR
jgi:CPA1 family monovalent cation:H+ antiporter